MTVLRRRLTTASGYGGQTVSEDHRSVASCKSCDGITTAGLETDFDKSLAAPLTLCLISIQFAELDWLYGLLICTVLFHICANLDSI